MGTTIILIFIALIFFGCGFIVPGLFWVAGVFVILAILNTILRLIV
jgi:hypothetical protein